MNPIIYPEKNAIIIVIKMLCANSNNHGKIAFLGPHWPFKERITELTAQSNTKEKKDLVNVSDGKVTKLTEWATKDVNSVDEMIALFGENGVEYSRGEELTDDFRVVTGDEKPLFMKKILGCRLFCVRWEFYNGDNGEFVAVHALIEGHGKFIFNDGAKSGVYGQLSNITSKRLANNQPFDRAHSGLEVPRGIIQNKPFFYDDRTGKAIKKADLDNIPEEHKKPAKPTYRFQF